MKTCSLSDICKGSGGHRYEVNQQAKESLAYLTHKGFSIRAIDENSHLFSQVKWFVTAWLSRVGNTTVLVGYSRLHRRNKIKKKKKKEPELFS